MAVYRRSRRQRFVLLLLVLTSITVITLDFRGEDDGFLESVRRGARDVFAPVQSAADRVFAPVGDFFGGLTRYGDVKAENDRLRTELEQARGELLRQAGADRERQQLLELQQLTFAPSIPAVAARVVSDAPSNFQVTVSIDKGSDSGIERGMPVVTGAGLVGRVADVSRTRSTVLLITDRASNVGVRLQTSGDVGVATGEGARQPMRVDLVQLETRVAAGEPVVTSGLQQSVFPAEIPVGRVRSARVAPGALKQEVTVDPVVDLGRLEFVKVLRWRAQP
ncbi:MAG TPA: rod shape-determining protein MreC [Acidimicrobiales bacterium]|nr:rod shape-determining protein MreC [Acidimicrobiales bacterium]